VGLEKSFESISIVLSPIIILYSIVSNFAGNYDVPQKLDNNLRWKNLKL
jgi:hypothetical protein